MNRNSWLIIERNKTMRIGALLRIEVERAFKSRMFWLMLLLGIIITGIEFVIAPLRYSKDIIGAFDGLAELKDSGNSRRYGYRDPDLSGAEHQKRNTHSKLRKNGMAE